MHDSWHGQPETLTEKSYMCQAEHDWARTSISFLNYSVFQMASTASGKIPRSEPFNEHASSRTP